MKGLEELDDMNLWDITANEGVLTMIVLSVAFAILAVMYSAFGLYYYSIKLWRRLL